MRMEHESYTYNHKAMFITLTFSDEGLEKRLKENGIQIASIAKEDVQKFFKRLRKGWTESKIKYFACGEYGEQYGRPHYHAIIIGLDYCNLLHRKRVRDSWSYGNTYFGTVTPDSIRYVVSYIQKAYASKKIEPEKYFPNVNKPFQLQSQKIGLDYYMILENEILKTGTIKYQGKERTLPRYYHKKIKDKLSPEVKFNLQQKQKIKINKKADLQIDPFEILDSYHDPISGAVRDSRMKEKDIQSAKNIQAKINIKNSRKKKYGL